MYLLHRWQLAFVIRSETRLCGLGLWFAAQYLGGCRAICVHCYRFLTWWFFSFVEIWWLYFLRLSFSTPGSCILTFPDWADRWPSSVVTVAQESVKTTHSKTGISGKLQFLTVWKCRYILETIHLTPVRKPHTHILIHFHYLIGAHFTWLNLNK